MMSIVAFLRVQFDCSWVTRDRSLSLGRRGGGRAAKESAAQWAPISHFFPPDRDSRACTMGKKAAKATRKFAASGQLQKTIQARKKHQEVRRKVQGKKSRQDTKGKQSARGEVDEEDGDEEENVSPKKAGSKCVRSLCSFPTLNVTRRVGSSPWTTS
jgi:hypothetical protein